MTSKSTPTTTAQDRLAFLRQELGVFVGPYELKNERATTKPFVLDVRSAESFAKGHVPGATHIPRANLNERLSSLPKDRTIVVYCGDVTCFASKKAAVTLLENGFEDVRVLFGGFESWKQKGYDVTTGQTAATPGVN